MNLYYSTNIFTQKRNIFLELKSQGQFPEKEINVSRVPTFNLTVKCKNWDSVLHKDSRDFILKGTTYLGIQYVYYRGSLFSFVALTSYITRKFWGPRFLFSHSNLQIIGLGEMQLLPHKFHVKYHRNEYRLPNIHLISCIRQCSSVSCDNWRKLPHPNSIR